MAFCLFNCTLYRDPTIVGDLWPSSLSVGELGPVFLQDVYFGVTSTRGSSFNLSTTPSLGIPLLSFLCCLSLNPEVYEVYYSNRLFMILHRF